MGAKHLFMINVSIDKKEINIQECTNWVMDCECGGIDVFIGVVRPETNGKRVIQLDLDSYIPMALKEIKLITDHVQSTWNVKKILVHHRIGVLRVGDVPVVIAVAALHRAEAFDACRYIIDTLKKTVPIWKKEAFEDGDIWVDAHP